MSNIGLKLELIGDSLERIAKAVEVIVDKKKRTLRMVDVERGTVYKTHLGKSLSEPKAPAAPPSILGQGTASEPPAMAGDVTKMQVVTDLIKENARLRKQVEEAAQ